jgi:hypothetical protein
MYNQLCRMLNTLEHDIEEYDRKNGAMAKIREELGELFSMVVD